MIISAPNVWPRYVSATIARRPPGLSTRSATRVSAVGMNFKTWVMASRAAYTPSRVSNGPANDEHQP